VVKVGDGMKDKKYKMHYTNKECVYTWKYVTMFFIVGLILGFAYVIPYMLIQHGTTFGIGDKCEEEILLLCFRDSYLNSLESCTILIGDDTKGVWMPQADNETFTVSHYLIDKKDNEIFIIPNHKSIKYEFTNKTKQETIIEFKDNGGD